MLIQSHGTGCNRQFLQAAFTGAHYDVERRHSDVTNTANLHVHEFSISTCRALCNWLARTVKTLNGTMTVSGTTGLRIICSCPQVETSSPAALMAMVILLSTVSMSSDWTSLACASHAESDRVHGPQY